MELVGCEDVEARSHEVLASLVVHKWDCYGQAHMNIEMIAREVIRQYKEQKKQRSASKEYGTEEIYGYFQN